MPNAKHAQRLAIALLAALALVACSKNEDHAADPAAEARSSSAGLPEGRIAVGEQLANAKGKATGQSCIDCHGADGNAPIDGTYPKLGGQYADYLAHALQDYRGGRRQHALMTPQATSLTDQEIADLSAYFGSRPSQLRDLHGVY
ncbi:c-type cytochrome [Pseudoxanthomonas mexicana]|uniref:c-type cytochrome n=1 Tax=Pseudoxanthomonas mexicana TaxID=128785 RepID=UPI00398B3016